MGDADDVPEQGGPEWQAGVALVALRLVEGERLEQDVAT